MTVGYFLEYFEQTEILKQFQALFQKLCGLELQIRKIDGTLLQSASSPKGSSKNNKFSAVKRSLNLKACACPVNCKNCTEINPELLNQVVNERKPQYFTCSAGFKKILVPLILKEEVAGVLFTGENASFRLDVSQMGSIAGLLMQFVNYIIKNEINLLSQFKGSDLTHRQVILNKAMKYIRENCHRNISLREVSLDSGISYHYLSRLFKKELKTTFAQYRNQLRMDRAAKLLKDRRPTISQISYACGFDDPGYFCKVFKTAFGTSPEIFREKQFRKRR